MLHTFLKKFFIIHLQFFVPQTRELFSASLVIFLISIKNFHGSNGIYFYISVLHAEDIAEQKAKEIADFLSVPVSAGRIFATFCIPRISALLITATTAQRAQSPASLLQLFALVSGIDTEKSELCNTRNLTAKQVADSLF